MIARIEPGYPTQAATEHSRTEQGREPNRTLRTCGAPNPAWNGQEPSGTAGDSPVYFEDEIPRVPDFAEMMDREISGVNDLDESVAVLLPEDAAAFMERVPPLSPGTIQEVPEFIPDSELVLPPDPFHGHEGETYNFITRKWSSEP